MAPPVTPEEIALKRLNGAIAEYRRLCLKNHLLYSSSKTTAIILAALIPLIGVFEPTAVIALPLMKVNVTPIQLAAILGALSAMVHSFETFFQFHGQWIASNMTEDALTREKYLYLTQVEPYDVLPSGETLRYKTLARRVEAILAKANRQWYFRDAASERPQGAALKAPGVGLIPEKTLPLPGLSPSATEPLIASAG